jgi:hypothetical protein
MRPRSSCEYGRDSPSSWFSRRRRPITVDTVTLIVHWANEFAPTQRRSWQRGAGGVPATQDRSHQRPRPNRRRPDDAMDGDLLYGSDTVCVWVPVGGRPDWSSDRRSLMGIVGDLDVHRSHSTSKAGGAGGSPATQGRSHQRLRPNRRRAVGAGSPAQYRMRPNPPSDIGRPPVVPSSRTVPINAHVRIGGVP